MFIAGQRTGGYDFAGKGYLFILLLIQTLILVLLNISLHVYSTGVFPSFDLGTLVATSSAVIIISALATIFVADYLLKVTEREARLGTELRHVREMQKLNLQMRAQRHDFYNHLTAVYGYLTASHYHKAESYIEILYQDVRRIKDLLEINPPELGALLSLKQEAGKARGIEFRWRVSMESNILPLPPDELTQLTGNLLDNALDAAASGHPSRADLTLTTNKLGLMLKVSNTGAPIPQDIRSNIFAAGYTTKVRTQHSGLGLFIVKQIVNRHGGQLDLAEPEDYPGVQFVIFIPWNS
jgi:sensor histidine kinase regulating citrate/malate metabolism